MLMEIPATNPPGKAHYAYWENFLTDEEIEYILSVDEWNNKDRASVGLPTGIAIDEKVRITDVAWLHPNEENVNIWGKISGVIGQVNAQFFQYDLTGFYEPMQLTYYEADKDIENAGHYSWHLDLILDQPTVMRKLSMILMLSDPMEFEGGDLQIQIDSTGPVTLEQRRGRAWFFPSWALHQVTPVIRGVRKTAVVWGGGPPFK